VLIRGANRHTSGDAVPRPYLSLGMIAVGLIIAYMAYSSYQAMDGLEITGLVMFGLAFAAALAVKLFITDKAEPSAGPHRPTTDDSSLRSSTEDAKRET
jgi:hypothetical protein